MVFKKKTVQKVRRDGAQITMPQELRDDEKLNKALAYGFFDRSKFVRICLITFKNLVEKLGLEKGIEEMKKRLDVK